MPKPAATAARRLAVERAAVHHAHAHPEWGQARVSAAMTAAGLKVSPGGVRWIWQRHHLETTAKRAAALTKLGPARWTTEQKAALARLSDRRGASLDGDAPVLAREHLLAVAVREFSRKGFARTSIRDIAQAAGVQPGSLYHHFASKDDLFVEAHAAGMQQVTRAIEVAIGAETDPWARLEAACSVHVLHLISGNDLTVWTGASLFLFSSPEIQRQLRAERDRFEALYRRLIADLPLPRGVDRSLLRLQLLGALNWTRTWYRPGKRNAAEIAAHLVRVLRSPMAERR